MPTPLAILSGKKDEAELASIGKASKYSKMSILLRHKDIISRVFLEHCLILKVVKVQFFNPCHAYNLY